MNKQFNSDKYYHKVRLSYMHQAKHFSDVYKNMGYDYKNKILKSMISPEMYANPLQLGFYNTIETMINFLIEQVKYIKKTMSIAHSKETLNIN